MTGGGRQEAQRRQATGVQAARLGGDAAEERRLLAELLSGLAPLIERLVWRWIPSAGSLRPEDLRQVACMAVINGIAAYDPRGEFAPHIHARVNRDLGRYVLQHKADVHISVDGAQQAGRVKSAEGVTVSVESRDARVEANHESTKCTYTEETETVTAEALYLEAEGKHELYEAIRTLPQLQRDLLRAHFGIGQEPQSIRDLHVKQGMSRTRATSLIEDALAQLRKAMGKR